MVNLQVTLPDWAGQYIQEQIAAGRYQSADELLTQLIDQARVVVASDRLAELILEGENSGEGEEYSEEKWLQRREQLLAEAKKKLVVRSRAEIETALLDE
jgi:putative addiction module CopG family antidote